jgi:hypothetical protein
VGLLFAVRLLGEAIADPSINYIITVPGAGGAKIAFIAELSISFGMMLMILFVSNTPKLSRFTGIFAGVLIATYYNHRSTPIGYEYESSPYLSIGNSCSQLDSYLGLFYRTTFRNAFGC